MPYDSPGTEELKPKASKNQWFLIFDQYLTYLRKGARQGHKMQGATQGHSYYGRLIE